MGCNCNADKYTFYIGMLDNFQESFFSRFEVLRSAWASLLEKFIFALIHALVLE